jgi:hypothetical protein
MELLSMSDVTTASAVTPTVDQDVQRSAFERLRAKMEAIPVKKPCVLQCRSCAAP